MSGTEMVLTLQKVRDLPSSCLWTLKSSFRIDVISWNKDVHSSSEPNTGRHTSAAFLWATNLIGGFDDGNVIFRINFDFDLLPDIHSVLEQCPDQRWRELMFLQASHPFKRFWFFQLYRILLKYTVVVKNVLSRFSYLILAASCSVLSLISTMTWDTGFNIRLSTCRRKDILWSFTQDRKHRRLMQNHQMTSSVLWSCCLVLSLWSMLLCTGSLFNVVPAETLWWFTPASGISLTGCNTVRIYIWFSIVLTRTGGTAKSKTDNIHTLELEICCLKKTDSTPFPEWPQWWQLDTCLGAHHLLPHRGSLWLRWRGLSPSLDSTYKKLLSVIKSSTLIRAPFPLKRKAFFTVQSQHCGWTSCGEFLLHVCCPPTLCWPVLDGGRPRAEVWVGAEAAGCGELRKVGSVCF